VIDRLRQDLVLAARTLRRSRGVTVLAVASLAIGVAANATVFSVVQAIEFPRLIYPAASGIVFLESKNDVRHLAGMPVSAPDAMDIATQSRTLEQAALAADQTSILRIGTTARRVNGRRVTPAFFATMGVRPALGRALTPGDDQAGIVLGDRLWRSAFASDPEVVGRGVGLDGGVVTVVGVMPARFDTDAEFWTTLASTAGYARDDRQFTLFARLAPGATMREATRELADISARLASEYPGTSRDWITTPIALTHLHGRDARTTFLLLQAAVAIVLLIACANIANLLLARGARRQQEMAVRLSLGATRARLIASLLIESLLLAVTGGIAGLWVSMWSIRLIRLLPGIADVVEPSLNAIVLGFTLAVTMLTGILCGIVPALRASGVAPDLALRGDDRRISGGRGSLSSALVVGQIASALALVACGGLMLRTIVNRSHVDLGFDPRGAIRADLSLPFERFGEPAAALGASRAILDRVTQSPGIAAAGVSTWALPTAAGGQREITLPGDRDRALPGSIRRGVDAVSPGYFDALGATVTAGRGFSEADRDSGQPVAIINDALARALWPSRSLIGQRLRLGSIAERGPIVTVVGVVRTIRRSAMHDVPIARVYLPYAQYPNPAMTIVVRSRGDIRAAERALESAVSRTDPGLFVEGMRTMDADVAQFVAPVRLMTMVLAAFGLTGLLLAASGVFGTMSYAVSQRRREIAVRVALGADRQEIFALVLRSAGTLIGAGLIGGVATAFVVTRAVATFLFGVGPTDPVTFAAVTAILLAVSLAACFHPARVAAGTDPMEILRQP
jgi:predicted permease